MRRREGFSEAERKILGFFLQSGAEPIRKLIDINSIGLRSALKWILDFEDFGYVRLVKGSWDENIDCIVFDLTLKGLIKILQEQILREKVSDSFEYICQTHKEKCLVLKYFPIFLEKEVDELVKARLMNEWSYRYSFDLKDMLWSTVPGIRDSSTVVTSKALGIHLLVYDRHIVEKELKQNFPAQLKLFEIVEETPELAKIRRNYINARKRDVERILHNIESWNKHTIV
jgi:hypothetical protein